jgi:hypothetical protein
MRRALSVLVLASPALAHADEVHLRSGGKLSGVVVEHNERVVVLEAEPGRITLPATYVVRIVSGASELAQYRERAARIAPGDAEAWVELGRWAQGRGLGTLSRQAFAQALDAAPANTDAHMALGHVLLDGRWVTEDEAFRARGYVYFEGGWVRPEEREDILAERAAAAESERQWAAAEAARAEAEARVREAEARARAAEAEARRVEADAERQAEYLPGGIPYGYVFAGGDAYAPYAPYPPLAASPFVVLGDGGGRGHRGHAPACARDGSGRSGPGPARRGSVGRTATAGVGGGAARRRN